MHANIPIGDILSKNSNYLFKLDLLILSILRIEDAYGYEITKLIAKLSNGVIVPKQGTMYPIIYKLLEEKFITSYTKIVNNKARVYYHIEDKGIDHFMKIRSEYKEIVKYIDLIIDGGEQSESE